MPTKICFAATLLACQPPPPVSPLNPYDVVMNQPTRSPDQVADQGVPVQVVPQRPALPYGPIPVYTEKRLPRPTEVVGVLDFHSDAKSQDKGFDELRARAAAMGADAVIGAEYEHGTDKEPSHLAGMAVRFLDR